MRMEIFEFTSSIISTNTMNQCYFVVLYVNAIRLLHVVSSLMMELMPPVCNSRLLFINVASESKWR